MTTFVEIAKRQYDDSFIMLYELINACPDELWIKSKCGFPFWQQVYHALSGSDYWIRVNYQSDNFWSAVPDKNVSGELDESVTVFNEYLTKAELSDLFKKFEAKKEIFFSELNDEKLNHSVYIHRKEYTYLDIISTQIRHIMCHVGQCNCILTECGYHAVLWKAYNEERQ